MNGFGNAEWGSAEQIYAQFGLTKGTLYKLASDGRIKWALVKTSRDARKGIRLFNVQSIRELLSASTF